MSNLYDWDDVIEHIKRTECTPVIGNQLMGDLIFGGVDIVAKWAENEGYPLAGQRNLSRVAQYLSATRQDDIRAKTRYLRFLNRQLLDDPARLSGMLPEVASQVKREGASLSLSVLTADRLRYPNFASQPDNPLSILAALPIPIYLTTSPHRFIEAALLAVNKTPRTEVYAWREDIEDSLPDQVRPNLNYVPTVAAPLVFHLHGIDHVPRSLVLTEDDYLDFLVNVTQDLRDPTIMPASVRNAISYSFLLLIGYRMYAWDLRVLLRGMLKDKPNRPRSFSVQLATERMEGVLNAEGVRNYFKQYFNQSKFDIYWGETQEFLQTLWHAWEMA